MAKGSRPFTAATEDGRPLFIKVLGSDQRDADLLYRAYRFLRLRDIGDTRPAASLIQAAEHQALVAVMAERAGVAVPAVRQVIKSADGSAVLAMDRVDGRSLDLIPVQRVDDAMIRELWTQVDRLHRARIAHRSLRAANVVVDGTARPWIVDFSFAELGATQRQIALDVAELLASLAVIAGADRAVSAAAEVIGPDRVAAAVPLLQPLALSAGTRRAIARHEGLLTRTRKAAAAASGREDTELARIQRVRPRTLLAVAAAAGAFYFLLPKLAQVGSSWRAVQSASWAWVPLVIALSVATYLASAIGLMGAVPQRIRLWPTVLAQGASSFVNRVSPANVGGMALNARYLQKSGVPASAGVAAVGVNSLAGAIVHLILIVVFFAWSGSGLGQAFKLPSSSKLLAILAVVVAVIGIVLATRPGRRFAKGKLIPGLRSAAASLGQVAQRPGKMAMLFGGSALRHAGLHRRVRRLGRGVRRGTGHHRHRSGVPGGLGAGRGRPHPRWPWCHRGGPGRRPDRCRHGSGTRGFRGAAVPAGHLLAPGGTGLAVLAGAAAAGIRMKPRAMFGAVCIGLAAVLPACTSSSGNVPPPAAEQAARHGAVITVGSFDFPESVLLAEIYGQALAAGELPGAGPAGSGPP